MTSNGNGALPMGHAIEVQYAHEPMASSDEPPPPSDVRKCLKAVLPKDARVTVRFVAAEESRAANLGFLGKDKPANVLSFPDPDASTLAGDVAICPKVVVKEAKEWGILARDRYAHLLVHAALHLMGMDHDTPDSAKKMERAETRALASLGLPNPYAKD